MVIMKDLSVLSSIYLITEDLHLFLIADRPLLLPVAEDQEDRRD